MRRPATQDTRAQEALIEEASAALAADTRIVACWLEGSFATTRADPWSDVDVHVAVADEHWDRVLLERIVLISRIRPVVGFIEITLPWGARLVSASVSGPVRLDLFIEKQSAVASAPRREQPVVLFDRGEVAHSLRVNWDHEMIIRLQLTQLLQAFFFGSAWPVRLTGREEWGTMLMNALFIVYEFLVPAMLIQDDAVDFVRPRYHNERHLQSEKRRRIDALLEQIRAAFDGIGRGELDQARVALAHQHLIGDIWSEFRRACEMHGVVYPVEAEREMREFYRQEMGWAIPE